MEGSYLSPHSHVVFSQDVSDRNFETVILFKSVQRLYNKAYGVDTNHRSLGVRVVSCTPWLKVFIEGMVVSIPKRIIWLKIGSSSSLLRVKRDGGQLAPLQQPLVSPTTSD